MELEKGKSYWTRDGRVARNLIVLETQDGSMYRFFCSGLRCSWAKNGKYDFVGEPHDNDLIAVAFDGETFYEARARQDGAAETPATEGEALRVGERVRLEDVTGCTRAHGRPWWR